jgi:DNA-binding protein YbaB
MPREIDEAWIEQAIERYRRFGKARQRYEEAIQAQTVEVVSPDGTVEIVVRATGDVTDVRVHPRPGATHADLAREVHAVITNAAEAARWARSKIYDEIYAAHERPDDL